MIMPGVCPRCDKNVYFAEEVKGLGQVYHKLCFSCSACRKLLDSGNITEHDGQMFCNSCYRWHSTLRNLRYSELSFTGRTLVPRAMGSEEERERCQWMMVLDTSLTPMLLTTKPRPTLHQRNHSCQATLPPTSKVCMNIILLFKC